jgi:hypothetical protein
MLGPVRSLACGAAVQRRIASRAFLGPGLLFVGTRLARRIVALSRPLLVCDRLVVEGSSQFLDVVLVNARD